MARGINKVILVGNLGADPDMRTIAGSGKQVANISVATSESWNDKYTGEKREKTEWHRVVAFDRLAEIIGQYCRKGSKVYVEGRLQTNSYVDKEGIQRYSTDIIANELQMLDSRNSGDVPFEQGENYSQPQSEHVNQSQNQNSYSEKASYSAPNKEPNQPVSPKTTPQKNYGPEPDIDSSFDDDSIPF